MVKLLSVLLVVLALALGGRYFLRRVWFYRDPLRVPPELPRAILSPADGTVVYVRPFSGGMVVAEKLGRKIAVDEICRAGATGASEGWIVGVYMSPLDVHFNYAPVAGKVESVVYTPARVNLPMVDLWEYVRLAYLRRAVDLFSHRYRLVNERNTIFIRGEGPRVAVVEIADKFVNKIRCFVRPGEWLTAGQKLSFIEWGSQVDLVIFEPGVKILVRPGQKVIGARTVIAEYPL